MKTICLDPAAHWPDNIGLDGYSEREGAWDIALACERLLLTSYSDKCRVVLTRGSKDGLKLRYPRYLTEEVNRMNASGADYSISIHTDANRRSSARGVTCFKGGPLSEGLGNRLLLAIKNNFTSVELPLFHSVARFHYKGPTYLAVIRRTIMPTVLIECGFHTNRQDMELLGTYDGKQRIGYALADGIAGFFGWEPGVPEPPENSDFVLTVLPGYEASFDCAPRSSHSVAALRDLARRENIVIIDHWDDQRKFYLEAQEE